MSRRHRRHAAQEQRGFPPAPGAGTATQERVTMPSTPGEAPESALPDSVGHNWPEQGYDGPQPWEVENPPELTHDRGFIASGSAGPEVTELAACLARLGIATSISEGRNPHAEYGPTERAAVREFCSRYGVQEAPEVVRATGRDVVGPWIWQALFDAVAKA